MTLPIPPYTRLPVTVHTGVADQVATLNALAVAGGRRYAQQVLRVDDTGTELEDLTPYLVKPSGGAVAAVTHDSTAECPGKFAFGLAKALKWGFDRVQPLALISSPFYQAGAWHAFPRGMFVVTSPGRDNLDHDSAYNVTGWDRVYLLQCDPLIAYTFAPGSTYLAALTAVFRGAGVLGGAAALSTIASYPGDWAAKTLPAVQSFPPGSGTHLAIANKLLTASGALPLYTDPTTGQWTISNQPVPATQALAWRWQGSNITNPPSGLGDTGYPDRKIVRYSSQSYSGDVYNAPNQWRFIQSGLTFQPTEGSGQYTVNNTVDPPADQTTVGRVIPKVVLLDASGQADLKTQGDAIVTADKASLEKITLSTIPWPAAGHFDVFTYAHAALPGSPMRRVQAQSWTLPLAGGPMQWTTNVVAQQ